MSDAAPHTASPGSAAVHRSTARQGRRASFALSLAGAFGLNVVVIAVFAAVVMRWHAPAGAAHRAAWVTAVAIERGPPIELREPESGATSSVTALPRKALDATPALPQHSPAKMPTRQGSNDDGTPTRFYKFQEVERPAEPDSDWNLDTATLDAAGVDKLVFEIFVGRHGEVVECYVLQPATLAAETRQRIEDRLRLTVLQPALREGVAVASVRRIEVTIVPPAS